MRFCPRCRKKYEQGFNKCANCDVDLAELSETPPPSEKLITIAVFDSSARASILASRLESEGIPCSLSDEETIAAHPLLAGAVGGVKLQVPESHAQRASAIARAVSGRLCPKCGSPGFAPQPLSVAQGCLCLILLGIPLLYMRARWRCNKCGHAEESPGQAAN